MTQPKTKVRCDNCGTWLSLDTTEERVRCECGRQYVVTVTEIPLQTP